MNMDSLLGLSISSWRIFIIYSIEVDWEFETREYSPTSEYRLLSIEDIFSLYVDM